MPSTSICAPGDGAIFPTGDSRTTADIHVFGVEQVAGADGNLLNEPLYVQLGSPLGAAIVAAFSLDPDSHTLTPGDCVNVNVMVNNPTVNDADYGDNVVIMKAQDPGSGIGVGTGSRYNLRRRAATLIDTTPPDVAIKSPSDLDVDGTLVQQVESDVVAF